jgi:hypothetical protein
MKGVAMSRSEISKAIMELESIDDVYVVLVTALNLDQLKQLVEMLDQKRIRPYYFTQDPF